MLEIPARAIDAALIRMPDGCRTIRRGARPIMIRVPTPFDFILSKSGLGCAFLDTKTTQGSLFPMDKITPHQIQGLGLLSRQGHPAGYVIWFRSHDVVRWFDVYELTRPRTRRSLACNEGVSLGSLTRMDLRPIFIKDRSEPS